MNQWKEYFGGLLVGGCSGGRKNTVDRMWSQRWRRNALEVIAAIAKLKKGMAPGVCGISAEMLKAGGRVVAEWLHMIINLM